MLYSQLGRGSAQQVTAAANQPKGTPGGPGLGDSLYPNFGNGGYDAKHYTVNLNVTNPTTSALSGVTTVQARATKNLSKFNLDFIGFAIDGITVNGKPATFSRSGQELTITPATTLRKNEDFTVKVSYNGSPTQITSVALPVLTGWVNFGSGSFVLSEPDGAANYYPVNDHPLDKASYTFRVTVPHPYDVAVNGVLTKTIDNGTSTTSVFNARDPLASYLTTVNISQFNRQTGQKARGIPIRNYFGEGIAPDLLKPFDRQPAMLRFFSRIYGQYPFDVYGSVVMNTKTGSALETQTLSIFGTDQLGRTRLGNSTEEVIAHELAHQWFGDSVALSDWSDIWLNEGFATYSQGLWVEYSQGGAAFDQWVKNEYDSVQENLADLVPPGKPKADDLFNSGVYDWAAVGLHALRLRLGDDDFFQTLRTYADRYKNSNVKQNDFRRVAEEVSGDNLAGFFKRWFYSDTLPPLPNRKPTEDSLVGKSGVNLSNYPRSTQAKVTLTDRTGSNQGGFYAVDNPYGVVVDPVTGNRINPGEKGYAKAALAQSVKTLDREGETLTLHGGSYYVPYLSVDGKPGQFSSPFTKGGTVQLSSAGAYGFSERSVDNASFNDLVLQVSI
ncbi:MAG TPA: M1 family metallopeptidase [Coleofasciculaceae cyanobacterium]